MKIMIIYIQICIRICVTQQQFVYYRDLCHLYEQLCKSVLSAFEDYKFKRVSDTWRTLQDIFNEVIKVI